MTPLSAVRITSAVFWRPIARRPPRWGRFGGRTDYSRATLRRGIPLARRHALCLAPHAVSPSRGHPPLVPIRSLAYFCGIDEHLDEHDYNPGYFIYLRTSSDACIAQRTATTPRHPP